VRLAHRDVRDHIKYSKTGCWRSYRFYRASQRLKSPTCIICEILEARDFRFFASILFIAKTQQSGSVAGIHNAVTVYRAELSTPLEALRTS
jgi:hypothetical protein